MYEKLNNYNEMTLPSLLIIIMNFECNHLLYYICVIHNLLWYCSFIRQSLSLRDKGMNIQLVQYEMSFILSSFLFLIFGGSFSHSLAPL